jgi:hypothetical protein
MSDPNDHRPTPDGAWPGDDSSPTSDPTGPPSYAEADPRVLPGETKPSPSSSDNPDAQDQTQPT